MVSAVLRAFENVFDVAGDVLRAFEDASRTSVSLKILYLCRSVRGLLPAYGLQSTQERDKDRISQQKTAILTTSQHESAIS